MPIAFQNTVSQNIGFIDHSNALAPTHPPKTLYNTWRLRRPGLRLQARRGFLVALPNTTGGRHTSWVSMRKAMYTTPLALLARHWSPCRIESPQLESDQVLHRRKKERNERDTVRRRKDMKSFCPLAGSRVPFLSMWATVTDQLQAQLGKMWGKKMISV